MSVPLSDEWIKASQPTLHVLSTFTELFVPLNTILSSINMSQSMEIDYHVWLRNVPTAGGGEDQSKVNISNPVPQQVGSRRRVDTMSSVRSHIGLKPEAPIDEEHEELKHHELLWSRIRLALREPFAEFFGTFIMVLFGDGSVAQVLLSASKTTSTFAPGMDGYGNYQSISWG